MGFEFNFSSNNELKTPVHQEISSPGKRIEINAEEIEFHYELVQTASRTLIQRCNMLTKNFL